MANLKKAAVIVVTIYGNGADTTFNLDLLRDPYFVTYQTGSFAESPSNWFSQNPASNPPAFSQNPASNPPVDVFVNPGDSASLSGFVLSYTYASAPSVGPHALEIGLLF